MYWYVLTLILCFFGCLLAVGGAVTPLPPAFYGGVVLLALAVVTGVKTRQELKLAQQR